MNDSEIDLETGGVFRADSNADGPGNGTGAPAPELRCSITGQVMLDPCIVPGGRACDAFDVAMQLTAQYLDGIGGSNVCIYESHSRDSRVLCADVKPGAMIYGVPMLRSWFRGAMAPSRIEVDANVDGPWPGSDGSRRKGSPEGRWSVRGGGPGGPEAATVWYHSFRPDVLDRVGWADAPIHDLALVFENSDEVAAARRFSAQPQQHPPLNDAWNRARDLQGALGTGPLLFFGKVHVRAPGAADGKGGTDVRLCGCMHYRDGARANGTFSPAGLLHGASANCTGIRCPRGRSVVRAREWVRGEPAGSYSGEASARLNPSARYTFHGYWTARKSAGPGGGRPGREEWFACAFPGGAAGSPAAPGRDLVVHIVDQQDGSGCDADGGVRPPTTPPATLEFQMTIKRISLGVSRVVGSPADPVVKRVGFCWAHVYDRELDREFAVCFSGTVRWSDYDFTASGPAVSFTHVEDLDMFGHASLARRAPADERALVGWPPLGSGARGGPDWVARMSSHPDYITEGGGAAGAGGAPLGAGPFSDTISVYAVSRLGGAADRKRARGLSPESSARYDEVDLGNHANRIVRAAHDRVKWISNAWILACRDAVTSRVPLSGALKSGSA